MFIKRLGYFLLGVSISSIGVYFFWEKKNASFDYGMDARTLKTIRIKERFFSEDAKKVMQNSNLDTLKISTILNNGNVDFGNSKPRQKPCAEYVITGKKDLENVNLYITRCDSTATIDKIIID
ncbi:DUF4258 domain-containing protein [Polaribacter vadi]|uniref:DUF4258 domain-containing protein n=1 Tax=Polaribacter TaxID=52959 RepID=UPI001C084033|nr:MULTISPECIES: DUF4258 domain-containing protein [Polaribacter]MBU3011722.1 DUF4258 domain-containing protein [Polaribacter vadi]MDO6741535.1 DUF4258 domain-containing protein [Polaribacter sp. 1_MG-2023]